MQRTRPIVGFSLFLACLVPAWNSSARGQCGVWSPPVNLSNDAGRYAVDAHLAVDSRGVVHLIYQSFLDSSGRNYYVTNEGGTWSAPLNLGSMGGKGSTPRIVITPDNQLHAFFGKNTLYYRSKPVLGGGWSAAQQVTVSPDEGFVEGITVDSAGGIYFMYGHLFDDTAPARNGIYGRYKPLGGAWGPAELIYGNSQDGNWPRGEQITARGTTLWVTIGVDGNMYYKKKPSTGSWPAGRGTLFNEEGGGLRFAMDPGSSEIAALWTRSLDCTDPCEDDPWYETYVKYSYDDGATWTPAHNISSMADDIDRSPTGVYDSSGNLHVVWEGFCCDHKLRMRYRGRIAGTWGPVQQLTSHVGGYVTDSLKAYGPNLFFAFSDADTEIGLYDVVYTSYTPTGPRLAVSDTSLSHTIWVGQSLPADTLTVANTCPGALNYTINDNAEWLAVTPTSGTSNGELDVITISYPGVSGLVRGTYPAAVIISGNAANSPQTVNVTVTVRTVPPDADGDGDVDQSDFGQFQACLSGASIAQDDSACRWALLDADSDVDPDDFSIFAACFSGANVIADPACVGG